MKNIKTRDETHVFKKPGNWDECSGGNDCGDLSVRADKFANTEIVQLNSTWRPTADELAKLNRGGVIEVSLLQPTQPPMCVGVVDPIEEVIVDDRHGSKSITINEDGHGLGYDEHGVSHP